MVRVTTVLLLVLSLGLHWALLQTVAWTGMVISYSHNASLSQAITRTFDGKHPCALCLSIQKGRAEERQKGQPQQSSLDLKLDPAVLWEPRTLLFISVHLPMDSSNWPACTRPESPPTPPPRCTWG